MLPAEKVPIFDGKGSSFKDYEQQVRLWVPIAHLEPSKRAGTRQVRLSAGGDRLESNHGAMYILDISMNYFALGAGDSIYREVARSLQYRWRGQTTDGYIAEFAALRREAESKMEMGAGPPKPLFPSCACSTRRYPAKRSRRRWPPPGRA